MSDLSPDFSLRLSISKSESSCRSSTEAKRKRKPEDNSQQLTDIISKLKHENLSYHWQNNELKCENRRLLRLNEENQENQKSLLMEYEVMKKSVMEQKLMLKQLREENNYLQSLVHNRNHPLAMFPLSKLSPERDQMSTELPQPIIRLEKSNINHIID